jgi:hypothetical protein
MHWMSVKLPDNFQMREQQQFLSVCQKRFNKLKNINISKTSQQNDFYYTRVPGFSGIGRTGEGTRLNEYYLPIFILSIHFRQISFFKITKDIQSNMRASASSLWYEMCT